MAEQLIELCRLYQNTSKKTGRHYFVGNLSFSSKLLILQNLDAKETEPGWIVFLAEREQKPTTGKPSTPPPRAGIDLDLSRTPGKAG